MYTHTCVHIDTGSGGGRRLHSACVYVYSVVEEREREREGERERDKRIEIERERERERGIGRVKKGETQHASERASVAKRVYGNDVGGRGRVETAARAANVGPGPRCFRVCNLDSQ